MTYSINSIARIDFSDKKLNIISKRQFAFLNPGFNIGSDKMHFHCFVKVCPMSEETTCSDTDLNNAPNTCLAPTYYNPSGRRRREADLEQLQRSELDGSTTVEFIKTITMPSIAPEDCHTIVNGACVVKKDETPRSSSKQTIIATGLAAFLAAINL